jgi:broad specificity phosphatase PhoE
LDKLPTDLLLIRHGESIWNREGRVQGWLDPPLSERGLEQAVRLAERMSEWPIAAVYASTLERARVTAECIARAHKLAVTLDERLREHRLGAIQGLTGSEIHAKYPEQFALAGRTDRWVPAPDEEPVTEFMHRVRAAGDDVLSRHREQMVAIVSHGGSINRLLMSWLGIDPQRHPPFHVDNASLTHVRMTDALMQIRMLNDISHLPMDHAPHDVAAHW